MWNLAAALLGTQIMIKEREVAEKESSVLHSGEKSPQRAFPFHQANSSAYKLIIHPHLLQQ